MAVSHVEPVGAGTGRQAPNDSGGRASLFDAWPDGRPCATIARIPRPVTISARPFVFTTGVPRAGEDRPDRELFEALAAGKPEALGELYDRHATSLFRHALALTRKRADAEDLVQMVFVKLATTGAKLLGVRKPAGYLHRVVHTTWLDARRRIAGGERMADGVRVASRAPESGVEDSIDVLRALDDLPAAQREVIVLHVVEGFSFREIGRLTGVSLFTAAGRYRLAMNRLRHTLGGPRGAATRT